MSVERPVNEMLDERVVQVHGPGAEVGFGHIFNVMFNQFGCGYIFKSSKQDLLRRRQARLFG